jgi:hypothetical protein
MEDPSPSLKLLDLSSPIVAEVDLCFLCRELTTGLWRSSSSLQGGPSANWIGASSPLFVVHSQVVLLSHDTGGSDSRRDSLGVAAIPDGGREGSGGGP